MPISSSWVPVGAAASRGCSSVPSVSGAPSAVRVRSSSSPDRDPRDRTEVRREDVVHLPGRARTAPAFSRAQRPPAARARTMSGVPRPRARGRAPRRSRMGVLCVLRVRLATRVGGLRVASRSRRRRVGLKLRKRTRRDRRLWRPRVTRRRCRPSVPTGRARARTARRRPAATARQGRRRASGRVRTPAADPRGRRAHLLRGRHPLTVTPAPGWSPPLRPSRAGAPPAP